MRGVDTQTARLLVSLWRASQQLDPLAARRLLIDTLLDITTSMGDVAGQVTADFYDAVRADADVHSKFAAVPASVAPLDQVQASAGWATAPMRTPEFDPSTVLVRISGATRRLVRLTGRQTIINNTRRDPAKPRYARVTRPGACPFCLMLVSRGAVYSKDTSKFRSHDHCRCFATPVFNTSQLPDESKRLAEEWAEVTQGTRGPKEAQQAWKDHIKTKTGGAGGGGGTIPRAVLAGGSPDPRKVARDLLVKARGAETRITADIEAAIHAGGTTRARADSVFKTEESLARKTATVIDSGKSASGINDVIRYTAVADEATYWARGDRVLDAIRGRGYSVEKEFNGWNRSGYKGRNVTLRSPAGQLFELQIHTPASLDVAERTHPWWEIIRVGAAPKSEIKRLRALTNELFATVPIPPNT